ncbi:MAG: hypothetical protein KDA91_06550 [Planctomycetaceae bacterium]|nr:hypothetical protein [Planctomycetaceae bacterium]
MTAASPVAIPWPESQSADVRHSSISARVVISLGNPGLAVDYTRFLKEETDQQPHYTLMLVTPDGVVNPGDDPHVSLNAFLQPDYLRPLQSIDIVFLMGHSLTRDDLKTVQRISDSLTGLQTRCVVVRESLSSHFGDPSSDDIDDALRRYLTARVKTLSILHCGYVLSANSVMERIRDRWFVAAPLLHQRMTSTFVDGQRLFAAINQELVRNRTSLHTHPVAGLRGFREISILGQRRAWRDVFGERRANQSRPGIGPSMSNSVVGRMAALACRILSRLGLAIVIFGCIRLVGRISPGWRQLHFHTLKPRSVRELLALYNRHAVTDIQIAGYNNGVNHFGWEYPDRTVVQTILVPGRIRLRADSVSVDAGVTLKESIGQLNQANREFLVVPNYSWISMGTLFFVPVHGSGSRVSTLSDTIEEVLLFDAENDQFIRACRGDGVFQRAMYDTSRSLLLLRLRLRTKQKSRYFVKHSQMDNPSADQVLRLFDDPFACNVEVRKNKASAVSIDVRRYFEGEDADRVDAMELPRDSIGRIWDRLEETPIVSGLFHWFVRRFAFHVELFLTADEFRIFWDHHQSLPVSKIQLRRVLKDGILNSACRNQDCISADLFMTRGNRDVFCQFVATHMPDVRSNPGKQSL